ncbi:MAG: hypothetical protein NCW75_09000 [Phycisphaera sp.]|nr:MAG: hypothetical protein NCW75_09000 [Phycisphaera sp.]
MTVTMAVRLAAVSLFASCQTLLAQEPINPVDRAASISAFADGDQSVRFERLYRVFENEVIQGSPPASVAQASILAGPMGEFAFGVSTRLEVTATDAGRATAFCTDSLVFDVVVETPFSLSSRYDADTPVGAAATGGTVGVAVEGEGVITLSDGRVVSAVELRASDRPDGAAVGGRLSPGRYRMSVEFSANSAAVGGDAMTGLNAEALFTTSCRVDLNADGRVDIFDFLQYQTLFDDRDPRADFNGDGVFDIFDFLGYLDAFDDPC